MTSLNTLEQDVFYWQLELEKAEYGLGMPRDPSRIAECRTQLELASQALDAELRRRMALWS